jgi:hypothetical protein
VSRRAGGACSAPRRGCGGRRRARQLAPRLTGAPTALLPSSSSPAQQNRRPVGPEDTGRRPSGSRWDEAKPSSVDRTDSWRADRPAGPGGSWRDERGGTQSGSGERRPAARWDNERWGGGGGGGGAEPGGGGGGDRWGGGGGGGPRGGGREWGERERDGRDHWGGGGGGGGGGREWGEGGGNPSWMGEEDAARGGPMGRPGPMTAKDIERERQEMQQKWRAEAAKRKVRARTRARARRLGRRPGSAPRPHATPRPATPRRA